MRNHKLYSNYVCQLKQYFISGISKVIDIRNVNHIDYPGFMTDEEAYAYDACEIEKDFIAVGKNLERALDSYGRSVRTFVIGSKNQNKKQDNTNNNKQE